MKPTYRSLKVRLKPRNNQEKLLWQSSGTARWAYNHCLDKQIKNYAENKTFLSNHDIRKQITQLKKEEEFSWLSNVSAQIPKQAIKDCCAAYVNFFKKKSSFPRFKSKKKSKPSFYVDNHKIKFSYKKVYVEKIGYITLAEFGRIPFTEETKYSNPRITFDGKYWYVSVGIKITEFSEEKKEKNNLVLGIDLGIKEFAVISNGRKFGNINKTKKVKKLKKKLRRMQRKVSRKYLKNKDGNKFIKTNNIVKLEKKIVLIHRKLRNIRENHIYEIIDYLVKTKPDKIIIENLNIKGMMKNRHLAKAIQEQCWYKFITLLAHKCEEHGMELFRVDRFFASSKICSNCGCIKTDLKLKDRVYVCNDCGNELDRDLNAAINLSKCG